MGDNRKCGGTDPTRKITSLPDSPLRIDVRPATSMQEVESPGSPRGSHGIYICVAV